METNDKSFRVSRVLLFYWVIRDWWSSKKMFVRSRLRLIWARIYIRKDEFHKSLDMDFEALMTMKGKQKEKYLKDLCDRREIAHRKEMGDM